MIAKLIDLIPILRSVCAWHARRRELPISREQADKMGLISYLADRGMSITWVQADQVEYRVRHCGFKRIKWKDPATKRNHVLINVPGRDYPLAIHITRY